MNIIKSEIFTNTQKNSSFQDLTANIVAEFQQIQAVEAIGLGGSLAAGARDHLSDIDLYILSDQIIPLERRYNIIQKFNPSRSNLNLSFWDPGDEWIDGMSGIEVDMIYWRKSWIEDQINKILTLYRANIGYSTSFWFTMKNMKVLFDRNGWLKNLQDKCHRPYPAELKKAIIAKNHPLLRDVIPSYYAQIKKAMERNDQISVNHRITAFLMSYFDVLFALNELPNPGEKRVLDYALENCNKLPTGFKENIESILRLNCVDVINFFDSIDKLIDGIDHLINLEGIDPAKTLALKKNHE
ncbi:DUF4037 domain-containing protein [bacterium]|nr:DUF4037 domain-containing protein [bacterium]MBU1065041.1 DUF4037 domain-containing protein [bacterium]MBU1874154.1 DUF4037 domain-containing protein [bacterium]